MELAAFRGESAAESCSAPGADEAAGSGVHERTPVQGVGTREDPRVGQLVDIGTGVN